MYQKQVIRKDLLQVLSTVSGGLAAKDVVPILSSYCFDGEYVTTFDDVVTMTTPCDVLAGFEGGLRGSVLTAWLNKQRKDSIKLTVDDGKARVTAGKARLSMPLFPKSEFQYQIPELEDSHCIEHSSHIMSAVVSAAQSLGLDVGHPWRLGITISFCEDGLDVYGSNNETCARSFVDLVVPDALRGKAFIIPPRLVELIQADKSAPLRWAFQNRTIGVEYPGDRWTYCRDLVGVRVDQHLAPFDYFDWKPDGFAEIPKELASMLETVLLIYPDKAIGTARMTLGPKTMTIEAATTSHGEVHEILDFDGKGQEGSYKIPLQILLACIKNMTVIRVNKMGIQLQSDTSDMLCSLVGDY